jgi:hypothetical protein
MLTLNRLAALAACVGLLAVGGPAFATGTRLDSMGGGSKYTTVEDEANIFEFPSLLVRYGNMTYVDNLNGAFANTRFGFHIAPIDELVIAVYGGRINEGTRPIGSGFDTAGNAFTGASGIGVGAQASQAGAAGGGPAGVQHASGAFCNPGPASPGSSMPPNPFCAGGVDASPNTMSNVDLKFGLLAAVMLGESTRLGLMLNILGDDGDSEQPENGAQLDRGSLMVDLALGLGLDLVDAELELSLGVEFGVLENFEDTIIAGTGQQGDLIEIWSASHFGIRVNARFLYEFDERYKLVTYAKIHYGSQEVSHNNMVAPALGGSWGGPDITAGLDLRMELFEDVFVVPGVGLRYAQQTLEGGGNVDRDVDRLVSLPFYSVGVDVKIWDWLDFRFGASQSVDFIRRSTTTAGVTVENRASSVATNLATGLGFHLPVQESMLSLDINVNPLFWIQGPDFISGNGSNPFGLTGAIKYDW